MAFNREEIIWAAGLFEGEGCHHNKALPEDANRMARRFVKELHAAGHTIERADFTYGAKENLCDEAQAHQDDKD